ncbi:hypothetical protein V6N13_061149 [Hibiscus sabdariffa]
MLMCRRLAGVGWTGGSDVASNSAVGSAGVSSLMILAARALHFWAREDSGMFVETSGRCSCGVCQSKTSSMDKFISSFWPASADGSAANTAAGGGAVVGWVGKKLAAFGNWKQRKLMREV